jgi:acetyltransferase-like isoleucine patch superfamily enzyme
MPGPKITIGNWVNVGFETFIGAKQELTIGDFTVIAPKCYIIDTEHGFDPGDVILNQRSTFAPVRIGRDCYLGTGTVVTKGVEIGDGAVIGANSVVTKDIGPYEVWAGAPARFVKMRVAVT